MLLRFCVGALLALGCSGTTGSRPTTTPVATPIETEPVASGEPPELDETIKLATFNIKVFGEKKSTNAEVMKTLAEVIRRYDVIAVQEIKDLSGEAPERLLGAVNTESDEPYGLLLSPPTGLQPDDAGSRERYAVYYRMLRISPDGEGTLYDDSRYDRFQREPYLVRLRTAKGSLSFVLIVIHTRPVSAVEEIGSLDQVVKWARDWAYGEDDFIVVGDLNASCRYASPARLAALEIRGPEYVWVVPDLADTNLSSTSICAYDRIVMTADTKEDFTGHWGVDDSFDDPSVSDHWPVWAEFFISADSNRDEPVF